MSTDMSLINEKYYVHVVGKKRSS